MQSNIFLYIPKLEFVECADKQMLVSIDTCHPIYSCEGCN